MIIETVKDNIRYRLSNEGLNIGDSVFPIGKGRQSDEGWFLHNIDWPNFRPNNPHIINKIDNFVRTNYGYGHNPTYFKIVRKEEHLEIESVGKIRRWEWFNIT